MSVNLVGKPKWRTNKFKPSKHITKAVTPNTDLIAPPLKANKPFSHKSIFCKKVGHIKKDCNGFKAWVTKRGNRNLDFKSNFFIEINLIDSAPHSWWLYLGSPLHITNSLQGYIRKRASRSDEVQSYVGNGMRVMVKYVGVLRLDLGSGNFLDLDNVLCVPSMRRNFLSISLLVNFGCSFLINSSGIKISRNSLSIGSGIFVNNYL